jgi:hypothetical protein
MGGFDGETLRAAFGIPSDFDPVACWALGYLGNPDQLPESYRNMELQARTRKPLQEFVFDEWEQAVKL